MFTGIIEHLGKIETLSVTSLAGRIKVYAPTLASALRVSGSVAVNGCCLTIVAVDNERFSADLSGETLQKTSFGALGGLQNGAPVNLERPLTAEKELGGHFVQGHVDDVGRVRHLTPESGDGGGSWWYAIEVPAELARYIVPKGSITIDGISLTVARWHDRIAEMAIIPYTYEHTNIRDRQPGDAVNIETDIFGKYIERYLQARDANS
ncbi:MAG: riboflavin synthase [Candidatus Acidiferrum sp.]